jgi:hypothetical protein
MPLLYSEIRDGAMDRDALCSIVRKVHWQELAMRIVGILSISWDVGIEDPAHQAALIDAMTKELPYADKIAAKLTAPGGKRLVFTREALVAVLRMAIVEASVNGLPDQDFADAFTRSALMANEILMSEITPKAPTNSAADLLPSELRSAIMQLENPHDLLERSSAFFEWSKTSKARESRNYHDVNADFLRFTGLTPLEFAAGSYFAFARNASMLNWPEVERIGIAFTIDQWQAGMADTRVVRQWFASRSSKLDDVRNEWREEPSLSFAAAGSLWRRPIVEAEAGLFFVPVPALVENTMGDGTYFILFDNYRDGVGPQRRAQKQAVHRFTSYYGEFFEDHVADLIARAYTGRDDVRLTREVTDRKGAKSTDVIVAEGSNVLFIEVVSKRMNLIDSVLRLKPDKIAGDIKAGVLDKARQIQTNIDRFRRGALLPDWPRPAGQRLFPVIVAPHDRPRINIIAMYLAKAAKSEGLLADVEPLELIDLGELEELEKVISDGHSLSELLVRKNRAQPHYRMMPMHNYLIFVEPNIVPPGMSPTRKLGSDVAKQIMELAKTWEAPKLP